MSQTTKITAFETGELLGKLKELLHKLPLLNGDEFFECLAEFDQCYSELYSRELSYSQFGKLYETNEEKEEILSQIEEKIDKVIAENLSIAEEIDIFTEKEKYFQNHKQWRELFGFKQKIANYLFSLVKNDLDNGGKNVNLMDTLYFLGVGEEVANTKVQMDKILRNPDLHTQDEITTAREYIKKFWECVWGDDEEANEIKDNVSQYIEKFEEVRDSLRDSFTEE